MLNTNCIYPVITFILSCHKSNLGETISNLRERVIAKEENLEYLSQPMQLLGSCQ
jgi:hypothetical protein